MCVNKRSHNRTTERMNDGGCHVCVCVCVHVRVCACVCVCLHVFVLSVCARQAGLLGVLSSCNSSFYQVSVHIRVQCAAANCC